MSVNALTDYGRSRQVIRLLQTALFLTRQAATIPEIASAMNIGERTVRRDLAALEAVPFPLTVNDGRWRIVGPVRLL